MNFEESIPIVRIGQGSSQGMLQVEKIYRGYDNLLVVIDGYDCLKDIWGQMSIRVTDAWGRVVISESFVCLI